MKGKTVTRKQKVSAIIITFPFLLAIILLIYGFSTLNNIYLYEGFRVSFAAITFLAVAHVSSLFILWKFDKIEIQLPPSKLKKKLSLIGLIFLSIVFSLLLEMGLRMNLNYWLKSSYVENVELIVIDKYISQGRRGTDRFIVFNSNYGRLINRVKRKKCESFSIGDKYKATVHQGFLKDIF